jgi:hypothetical protein
MWIINFETGFFTSVTLPEVDSATLKALDFGISIQKSNAFVVSKIIWFFTFSCLNLTTTLSFPHPKITGVLLML